VTRGVLPALAGVTAGAAVVFALAAGVSRPELRLGAGSAPARAEPPVSVRREELRALELQVELLRHAVDTLASEATALRAAAPRAEAPIAPTAPAEPPAPHSEPPDASGDLERLTALEARLGDEAEDAALGAFLTSELRGGLAAGRAAGATLRDATCSATLCRAEFALDAPAAESPVLLDLTQLVPWDGEGMLHVAGDDPRTAILYLDRDGVNLLTDDTPGTPRR